MLGHVQGGDEVSSRGRENMSVFARCAAGRDKERRCGRQAVTTEAQRRTSAPHQQVEGGKSRYLHRRGATHSLWSRTYPDNIWSRDDMQNRRGVAVGAWLAVTKTKIQG